jgi:basic amino acid/polyamine antiporter, APA family
MPTQINHSNSPQSIAPRLGLWDAVSIIVGIVVGTAIFRSSSDVFANSPSAWSAMALWILGGALSWCGAVCYAELATTYPQDGGDYVYLTRAYGPWCGFLFGWAQLTIVLSGNIAIMAYAFADYGEKLWSPLKDYDVLLTIAPVVALSAVNAIGIVVGKTAQNLLTLAKVVGIGGLVVAGLLAGDAKPQAAVGAAGDGMSANLGLALVFVLYAYGGWNHTAYVAAEVRDQRRNLPRSLFIGLACITLIYLAVNATYLAVLGFDAARLTPTPAADVMEQAIGVSSGRAFSLLVMLSALSAINGMILTGSRIYARWGADYPALHWLGAWNRSSSAPVAAIVVQAAIASLLILLVGTDSGRNLFDASLASLGLSELPWERFNGGFATLIAASTPVFWILSLLTGVAVFVLRIKDRGRERPFSVTLFPLPAIVFCATCIFMLRASLIYAKWLVLVGVAPLATGLIAWLIVRRTRRLRFS